MKWRNISEKEVKNTILNPEKLEDSTKGRRNAFKHIDKKWIKVTFKKQDDVAIIITAINKNK